MEEYWNWLIPLIIIVVLILLVLLQKWITQGPDNQHKPNLQGKVAIVTGSTGGIGYDCALELLRLGGKVYILGRNEKKGQ